MTLLEFMEGYKGFDWENGTLVISENNRVYMFKYGEGLWHFKMPVIKNRRVLDWTHDENVMALRIEAHVSVKELAEED